MSDTRRLLSHSSIVFAGTIVSGAFSYLFNILTARLLGPQDFSQLSAILSLFTVASVGGGAITFIAMRYAGELFYAERYKNLARVFSSLTRRSVKLAGLLFLMGVLLAVPISHFFSIGDPYALILAFSSLLFTFAAVVSKGVLQGTQRFGAVSLSSSLEMITRVVVLLGLVAVGFKLYGALAAVVLGSAVAYISTLPSIRKLLILSRNDTKEDEAPVVYRKELFNYAWLTLATSLFLTTLLSLDVLIAKRLFTEELAGQYAALSAVAKIIFFLTAPIVSVMFPMISEKTTRGEKHYQTFMLSFFLTALACFCIIAAYLFAPRVIVGALYGEAYLPLAPLLPKVGMYIVFYTFVNLFANYFIAIRDFAFLWFGAVVIVLQLVLVQFFHGSLSTLTAVLMSTLGLLFGLMVLRYLYLKRVQLYSLFTGSYAA